MKFTRHVLVDMDETQMQHCVICGELINDYRGAMVSPPDKEIKGWAAGPIFVSNTKNPKVFLSTLPEKEGYEDCIRRNNP